MKKALINTIVAAPIIYLMTAFLTLSVNFTTWSEEARYWCLCLGIIFPFMFSLLIQAVYYEPNDVR